MQFSDTCDDHDDIFNFIWKKKDDLKIESVEF